MDTDDLTTESRQTVPQVAPRVPKASDLQTSWLYETYSSLLIFAKEPIQWTPTLHLWLLLPLRTLLESFRNSVLALSTASIQETTRPSSCCWL